ncbi:MAG TPA: hypothetical protein DD437_16365 [Rhodobiaceae bacterium]|nr:hypothetical protein [Rhodobiaceae bacterium]|tara:strand:+ start:465 stop:1997 length:1533 start_codon:yes stop_codon:yes gene_type:complete
MAKPPKTLTNNLCKTLPEGRYRDAATPGLRLLVGKRARTFEFNAKIRGQIIRAKLGKMSDGVDINEARLRAQRARDRVDAGQQIDQTPTALSPDTVLSYTFGEAWDRYVRERLSTLSSGKESEGFVRHNALDHFKSLPLQSITRSDARQFSANLLKKVAKRQTEKQLALGKTPKPNVGHPTTRATHVALTTFFNWCIKNDLASINPFTGTMPEIKETIRDRVLSPEEIAIIMDALSDHQSPTYRGIIDMLIFTAMRLGEVTALRFGWINFAEKQIRIPSEHAKNAKVNIVALSDSALFILKACRTFAESDPDLQAPGTLDEAYVFSTGVNVHYSAESKDKKKLDELIAKLKPDMEHWTHHDIRRSVATRAAMNGTLHEHVERGILRHYPDKLTATYQVQPYVAHARTALMLWAEQVEQAQSAWEEIRRDVIWTNDNPEAYADMEKAGRERETLEGRIVGLKPNANGNGGEIIREGGSAIRAECDAAQSRYGRAHRGLKKRANLKLKHPNK